MTLLTFREALNQAIDEEMAKDKTVILMGEEVAQYNGPYKVSKGLLDKYGAQRVIDTPIAELGFTGIGVGAAMGGLKVIVEWMTFNFGLLAIDQIVNNAAKMSYMSAGSLQMPLVIRGPNGPAECLASQHSQNLASYFVHVPGIEVLSPSTPSKGKSLLKSAIRSPNTTIFLESEMMYGLKEEVDENEYYWPIGKADLVQSGDDLTLITYGISYHICQEAIKKIKLEHNVNVEFIDLLSLNPLDKELIFTSIRKTNRAVIVEEAWSQASVGNWIRALISSECFFDLDAPVELVCMEDVPMPYNATLEKNIKISLDKVIQSMLKTLYK